MNGILVSVLMAVVAAPPAKTSEERSTRIYVRTTPPGASVVLDGKELGTSDGLFLVPPGVRKITLEMEGYDPESKAVEVKEGWITRVEVRMERSGGEAGRGKAALSEDKIDEIKRLLARDKEKLNEMLDTHGEQYPMVRILKARIQNWERILEDPSIEAVLDRIDERAEELLNEIESTVDRSGGGYAGPRFGPVREVQVGDDGKATPADGEAAAPSADSMDSETRKKIQEAKVQLEMLGAAVEKYREDMGSAMHALGGLTKVPDDPKLNVAHLERWTGPYLKTEDGRLPLDPWGNSFWYSTDADRYGFQIASMGPDGRFSSADDIFFRSPGREVSSSKIPRGGETSTVDEGILEFRVAANEEEAKGFSEDCADLGWYDSLMDSTDHLVTRKQGGRTQVLLWNTPERSMTKGDSKEKRWQVIQVSVIAEPDRPGRVGVVFDKEGGRLLKELTGGNVGRQMAMLVDGRVVSCPMVQAAIGPRVEITGDFSKEELNRLATALQAGLEPRRPVLPNR